MAYVYIDYSGKWGVQKQRKIVLPALVCSKTKLSRAKYHVEKLKLKIESWGINTKSTDFEFHAQKIFNKLEIWEGLDDSQISEIVNDLRKVILTLQLPFALILVDKDARGKNSVEKFDEFIKAEADKELRLLSEDDKHFVEQELSRLVDNKDVGPLGYTSSLLFGLASSLIDLEGYPGHARVIIDKGELPNMRFWELLFKISRACMPSLLQLAKFPNRPKGWKPKWRLGSTIEDKDSVDELGLQLVDFVANTTAHLGKGDLAAQSAVVDQAKLRALDDYPGIYFFPPYYERSGKITRQVARTRKGRGWVVRRGG